VLHAGDIVTDVGGVPTAGLSLDHFVELIRYESGGLPTLSLGFKRPPEAALEAQRKARKARAAASVKSGLLSALKATRPLSEQQQAQQGQGKDQGASTRPAPALRDFGRLQSMRPVRARTHGIAALQLPELAAGSHTAHLSSTWGQRIVALRSLPPRLYLQREPHSVAAAWWRLPPAAAAAEHHDALDLLDAGVAHFVTEGTPCRQHIFEEFVQVGFC
jgi:hypothetical protein